MSTTDPKRGRPAPRLDLSPAEWKLGLTALLASVYAVGWLALARPEAPPVARRPSVVRPSVPPSRVASRAATPRIRTRSS